MTDTIYTIGHSNHTWESFGALLRDHAIELLVDTRSNPVSRFAPFTNSRTLPDLLDREDIEYVYLGGPLGGKPIDKSFYDDKGKPDYRRMRAEETFQEAVDQVASMARRSNVVLMCSEEDPSQCHRLLLLGPALEEEKGLRMLHIRSTGEAITTGRLGNLRKHRQQIQGTLPL